MKLVADSVELLLTVSLMLVDSVVVFTTESVALLTTAVSVVFADYTSPSVVVFYSVVVVLLDCV